MPLALKMGTAKETYVFFGDGNHLFRCSPVLSSRIIHYLHFIIDAVGTLLGDI